MAAVVAVATKANAPMAEAAALVAHPVALAAARVAVAAQAAATAARRAKLSHACLHRGVQIGARRVAIRQARLSVVMSNTVEAFEPLSERPV